MKSDPDKLTIAEVCRITGYSRNTIYSMLLDGRFPVRPIAPVRPYRFRRSEVEAWLDHTRVHGLR